MNNSNKAAFFSSEKQLRHRRILLLGLPIIGGMVSQSILNIVDTAMVGSLGEAALAAVGMGAFTSFMANAAVLGLGAGVQAMAARRVGEGRSDLAGEGLNSGLFLALVIGLPVSIMLWYLAPSIYFWLIDDPEVQRLGAEYFQIRVASVAAVGMNFAFRGFWNGVSMSAVYMRTLMLMHALNVFLNYTLIYGNFGAPELGSFGAGLGTSISLCVGALLYYIQAFWVARDKGFLARWPSREVLATTLRLGIPNSIQQLFFAGGLTALFWIIGQIGISELAVSNVLIQLLLVCVLPGMGLGLAAATLVGEALGRNDPEDAWAWGWDVAKLGVLLLGLLSLPLILAPELVLSVFVDDPELIKLGSLPLRILGIGIAFDSIGMVLMNALMGAGDAGTVARVSIFCQWVLMLPMVYIAGPWLGFGLLGVWVAQMLARTIQAYIFVRRWDSRAWAQIKV